MNLNTTFISQLQLRAEQIDLEQTKKALLLRRVNLFETFVQVNIKYKIYKRYIGNLVKLKCSIFQSLSGFPVSVKKRALLDTKEMLKKIKEQRGKTVGADMLPPPLPALMSPSIKTESKLSQ